MDTVYKDYLEKGTWKIMKLLSSSDISEEEKEAIITAFADELTDNIGDTGRLKDIEPLAYSASLRFVDTKLSRLLSEFEISDDELQEGIALCDRQKQLLNVFSSNNWTLPLIRNSNPDKCVEQLQDRQEARKICGRIIKEDRQIDELLNLVEKELSTSTCDRLLELNKALSQDISICNQKGIILPSINHKDTKRLADQITEKRKLAEYKEGLFKRIHNNDQRIHAIVTTEALSNGELNSITELCRSQSSLFKECNARKWLVPDVIHDNPEEIANQYLLYSTMLSIDNVIKLQKDSLSTNKQYNTFFETCRTQQQNINTCLENGWRLPKLDIKDPEVLGNKKLSEKAKRDKWRRILLALSIVAVFLIVGAVFGLVQYNKYISDKSEIPFDASYAVGKDYEEIYNELKTVGFTSIVNKPDSSGWLKDKEVISVTIDNSDTFSKGAYKNPDVGVVINYSSPDRIYVTELLKDWQTTEYTEIENSLREAGLTNISVNSVSTYEKERDHLTAKIDLNGETYTNEHCYIPKTAPVVISYYDLQIGIGNNSAEFIGQDYKEVAASLKESGFTNVQTQVITTGWAKDNSVVGVTVNNVDTYDSSQSFAPDVKIVVKYSSDNRIDLTADLNGWEKKGYEQLDKALKAKGFSTVKLIAKNTEVKHQNKYVASIKLNGEEYIAGECYVPKNSAIQIEYYNLQIKIGQTASSFENDQQYSDVVNRLKSKGFTNIRVQRADDILPIFFYPFKPKEGTIKEFTINGTSDFADTDSFDYDSEIIIIVHTLKNSGCEDITEIAK